MAIGINLEMMKDGTKNCRRALEDEVVSRIVSETS
jgi:hypothetical protein